MFFWILMMALFCWMEDSRLPFCFFFLSRNFVLGWNSKEAKLSLYLILYQKNIYNIWCILKWWRCLILLFINLALAKMYLGTIWQNDPARGICGTPSWLCGLLQDSLLPCALLYGSYSIHPIFDCSNPSRNVQISDSYSTSRQSSHPSYYPSLNSHAPTFTGTISWEMSNPPTVKAL